MELAVITLALLNLTLEVMVVQAVVAGVGLVLPQAVHDACRHRSAWRPAISQNFRTNSPYDRAISLRLGADGLPGGWDVGEGTAKRQHTRPGKPTPRSKHHSRLDVPYSSDSVEFL